LKPDDGMGSEWDGVLEVLSRLIPDYDRMNRTISLGRVERLREEGVRRGVGYDSIILDAGCGPGNMSETVCRVIGRVHTLVLLDPLTGMLHTARKRLRHDDSHFVLGVFEGLPFRVGSFDSVLCGYSLRDARVLSRALSEIHRVLKEGGRLVDVDLGKPDNMILRALMAVYWRLLVPIITTLKIGRRGMLYTALYRTYIRYPTNGRLKERLQSIFRQVVMSPQLFGGSVIIVAEK
jgi:demethylmenaquinone methyltransferase/2-methoxy-6-polyprenyl-1,4-benzoquinol methylase